jgi:hypothetical protein
MLENRERGCPCGRARFRARFDQINEGLALMLAGEVARGVVALDCGANVRLDRIVAFLL